MKMLREFCKVVQNNKTMIAIVLLLVVIYNQVQLDGLRESFITGSKQVVSETNKTYDLVFFSMDGCGYCKKFTPVWNQFASSSAKPSNVNTRIVKHNSSSEEDKALSKKMKDSIKGYPTVILMTEKQEEIAVFEGERTVEGLENFCKSNAK